MRRRAQQLQQATLASLTHCCRFEVQPCNSIKRATDGLKAAVWTAWTAKVFKVSLAMCHEFTPYPSMLATAKITALQKGVMAGFPGSSNKQAYI